MITSDQELRSANAALGDLQLALAALRREYAGAGVDTFALLAEGPLQEVQRIQSEIDSYTGASIAQHAQSPLWLKLVGSRAQWGETPASVVVSYLEALRRGVQSIAGFLAATPARGRVASEIRHACDFEVCFQPGSFEIGARLPSPNVEMGFSGEYGVAARDALANLISAAEWATQLDGDRAALEVIFPDPRTRVVVLDAVKTLVPRKDSGVEYVEMYGSTAAVRPQVHLTAEAVERIDQALSWSASETEECFEGDIRELDLDRRKFRLRNVPGLEAVRCRFPAQLSDAARRLMGCRVRVVGTRKRRLAKSAGELSVTFLEAL